MNGSYLAQSECARRHSTANAGGSEGANPLATAISLASAASTARSLTSDGFEPIRTRLGVAYQDDCLEMGLTWRRDYVTLGDAQRGNTFQLYFSLRNLGFR